MKNPILLHDTLLLQHLAYLRALAQGVSASVASRQYLTGQAHDREFKSHHEYVVDLARTVAMRRGFSAWRLLGVEIQSAVLQQPAKPSLDDWIETKGLSDWSVAEAQAQYDEAFADVPTDVGIMRKAARAERLIARRMAMLEALEVIAKTVVVPSPDDPIDGWFGGKVANHLVMAGITTLGSLRVKIDTGGQWWTPIAAIGPRKAARVAVAVTSLFPPAMTLVPQFRLALPALTVGSNRAPARPGSMAASSDQAAIQIWLKARTESVATERIYRREAVRFALFCEMERGVVLSGAGVEDCSAYVDFLNNIPSRWISRRRAPPFTPGWAPFRGQLSSAAKELSLTTLRSMFAWLLNAGYLASNPWILVSRRTNDDHIILPSSRSIPRNVWAVIINHLLEKKEDPSAIRLLFVLRFVVGTGLRPAELLAAQLGHLTDAGDSGMVLSVVGKGGHPRLVPVPTTALDALDTYLGTRGMVRGQDGLNAVPLVASTLKARAPVSYRVFLRSFKSLIRQALEESELSEGVQARVLSATLHWLRHTHAVRFVEAGGAIDILQENLGHTDSKTTAGYYQGELSRRAEAMRAAFDVV